MSLLLLETVTIPGETTIQFPSVEFKTHCAPVMGGVVIATDCDVPLTTDAQPERAAQATTTAAKRKPSNVQPP
jgi:hypothetical protein